MLQVIRPGVQTVVIDGGRWGYQAAGVGVGGPMDRFAFRVANLLAGNDPDAAALEIAVGGLEVVFGEPRRIAVCGELAAEAYGSRLPLWTAVWVKEGTSLRIVSTGAGRYGYLSVEGGIRVPAVLGSAGTHLRSGFGGFGGRALRAGDEVPLGARSGPMPEFPGQQPFFAGRIRVSSAWLERVRGRRMRQRIVRVFPGPEAERWERNAWDWLCGGTMTVSAQSDRMGYRLEAERPLDGTTAGEMISDAVAFGTVQLPPDGHPVVLMADCQTTGGYPRIGQAAAVDLPVLAQSLPGRRIRFEAVSREEAARLLFRQERELAVLAASWEQAWRHAWARE